MLNLNQIARNQCIGLGMSIFALLLLNSCSSKNAFLSSSVVPAARGYVKVKKDNNENYLIHLNVDYLAESSRLTPPMDTYVVWLENKQEQTKNIGQINNNNHSTAKNMKASFDTVSSSDPIRIFITAENDATVSYPGSPVVLTTGKIKS
jgi:hypothetical protein